MPIGAKKLEPITSEQMLPNWLSCFFQPQPDLLRDRIPIKDRLHDCIPIKHHKRMPYTAGT